MTTNDFKPIATGGGANVETQIAYVADPIVPIGFGVNAVPPSNLWNKMLRQTSVIISQFAQMVCDYSGLDMLDDGNLATLLTTIKTQFRIRLRANTTFYVRTDGNNANTGLVNNAGGAWLTKQHAYDVLQMQYDFNGFAVTVQVGDGAYAGGVVAQGPCVGQNSAILFQGNIGAPNNVVVSNGFVVQQGALLQVRGFQSAGSPTAFISTSGSAGISFGNIIFAGTPTVAHVHMDIGGTAASLADCTISGSSPAFVLSDSPGSRVVLSHQFTLTGTPAFSSAFATSTNLGFVFSNTGTYVGGATGKRYSADLNALINTLAGGATLFPGNAAGTTATGGQYA